MSLLAPALLALVTVPALAPAEAELAVGPTVDGLRGVYVEARSATIFAGACHYASEYTTTGREAVLAWRLEAGRVDGVSVAGIPVVAAVAAGANLDVADAERWSVVFLPEGLAPERRAAVLAWLRHEHGAALGTVRAVTETPISFAVDGDAFAVRAGESVSLAGGLLPDRECCTMPFNVWYRPFDAGVAKPVVGCVEELRLDDRRLGRKLVIRSSNCVFLGRFGEPSTDA